MRRALEYTIYNQELNETRAKLDEVNTHIMHTVYDHTTLMLPWKFYRSPCKNILTFITELSVLAVQ